MGRSIPALAAGWDIHLISQSGNFAGGLAAKTVLQCRGLGSIPDQGTTSHEPRLRVCVLQLKISHTTTKSQCSQINRHLKKCHRAPPPNPQSEFPDPHEPSGLASPGGLSWCVLGGPETSGEVQGRGC